VRIYLACTVRGDRGAIAAARAIAAALTSRGHQVVTGHLLDEDVNERESALSERAVFERDLAWLEESDVLVAEASGSSFGVGFEVGYVLGRSAATSQRVVLVYDRSRTATVSRLIVGATHARCAALGYDSPADAVAFVTNEVERILRDRSGTRGTSA
jgi:nucleoside 2-deoxyribosyltransferase